MRPTWIKLTSKINSNRLHHVNIANSNWITMRKNIPPIQEQQNTPVDVLKLVWIINPFMCINHIDSSE